MVGKWRDRRDTQQEWRTSKKSLHAQWNGQFVSGQPTKCLDHNPFWCRGLSENRLIGLPQDSYPSWNCNFGGWSFDSPFFRETHRTLAMFRSSRHPSFRLTASLAVELRPQPKSGWGRLWEVRVVSELTTTNQSTKMGISPENVLTKMSGGFGNQRM